MSEPTAQDVFIRTPRGRLFARRWTPPASRRAPIILFHDSLGSVELWRDFPPALAAATQRPVIAYDRLGFGRSDPHPTPLPTPPLAPLDPGFIRDEARAALPALRDALGIGRIVLFGHSVGGAMAVAAAGAFSEDALAVVTESAQAFVEDRTLAGIRNARAAFQAPGQLDRLARYHAAKARWVLDAWTETWLHPRFARWTLDDDLRRVRCPILAIHGDRDEYGSRLHPERIAAGAPGPNRAVILDGCGHVPHREQPDAVLRAVSAFLETIA